MFYFYSDNSINSNTLKQKLTHLQGETNKSTIIVWDFETPAKDWMFESPQIHMFKF